MIWIKALGELGDILKEIGLPRYESRLGLLGRDDLHNRSPGLIGGRQQVCIDKVQQETSMRKTLLGLVAAATLFGGLATAAETKVTIFFGSPYYSYQPGPDYLYYPNRGWYREQLSCNQARRIVRNRGYYNVSVIECRGRTYTFRAVRPNGRRVIVYVNSRTGGVWRG